MKTRLNDNAEKTILVDVNPYRTRVMLLENGVPVVNIHNCWLQENTFFNGFFQ